jgi:hypothetical protein
MGKINRFDLLTEKQESLIFEEDLSTELFERVPILAEYLLQYHQTMSQMAKSEYPENVHLDSQGIAILKQAPNFHSYNIRLHGAIAFGLAGKVLGLNYNSNDSISDSFFDTKKCHALLNQIISENGISEESTLRNSVLEKSAKLIQQLNLPTHEKLLMALGAGMHDIGKFAEPKIKSMEKIEKGISRIRIKKDENGTRLVIDNPFHFQIANHGAWNTPKGPSDHFQDELTVSIYLDMYRNGVLSGNECNQLVKVHEAFTKLSIGRYEISNGGIEELFNSIDKKSVAVKAVILLAIDELSKGNRFVDDLNAQKSRIDKFKYLIKLIELANGTIAQ